MGDGGEGEGGTPIYKLHRAAFQLSDHIKHGKKKICRIFENLSQTISPQNKTNFYYIIYFLLTSFLSNFVISRGF